MLDEIGEFKRNQKIVLYSDLQSLGIQLIHKLQLVGRTHQAYNDILTW